ncbi:response regulator [Rhizobium sp. S152]|uniref:response regulator n=1 Tax=Rhizobium sp. S152 TaxID=3055038 RepID=UPI0025A9F0DE|nr:response regulator [Rhizobium sp. S152]MDM9626556.1 response regulator [Rhizobium sp. S152]
MSAGFEKADTSSVSGEMPAEASLQTALFDAICESLASAFIIYDKTDHLLFASRQVTDFFPIPCDMLKPGTRLRDFLGAIYDTGIRASTIGAEAVGREDWLSQKIASHWRERFEAVERQGKDRWIRFQKRRLPSGYGVCAISDISEEKKREGQWRADLERVQLTEDVLDNLPFPLFVKDRNLNYVAVNIAFCEKYQTTVDEVLGRKSGDIFSPETTQRFEESDRHVLETGEMSISRQRQVARDGIERDIVTRKHRIGKPGRYFLVATMQDLPREGADLEEFELASSITASSKHSYKRAYVPINATERREPAAMEAIVPENFSGRKILVVTADIGAETAALRTLSKYGFEACSLRGEDEEEQFLEIISSAGISLDLIIIDNQLGMRCLELAEQHGIPSLVMDGFQLANELTYQIARHFNRSHRSSFTDAIDTDWEISTSEDDRALDVLVAEDNDINQIVFSQILEGLGYSYLIAPTGDEAVRLWTEHKPKIVLMDISLPGLNGFEAARLIRQMEEDGSSKTPIIGVLTQAFERDRAECARAGMDDVVMKPVSPDILQGVFQKHLGSERQRASL